MSRRKVGSRVVSVVFGTRPEAIKLAPVILELNGSLRLAPRVVFSGQHKDIAIPILESFGIAADVLMESSSDTQDIVTMNARLLNLISQDLKVCRPEAVIVQGDTATAFSAALAAFYSKIPVAHVEAGLRTNDLYAPFPEELYRRLITRIARWHFAPTQLAKATLIDEGVPYEDIVETGNTVIDAMHMVSEDDSDRKHWSSFPKGCRIILVTLHRRESFGENIREAMRGIRDVVEAFPNVRVLFPVHPNPEVVSAANEILGGIDRVSLVKPMIYKDFVLAMKHSHFIISDSGGIQEEAPAFGKPVLVVRDSTERSEAIFKGTSMLVGTDRSRIFQEASKLLNDEKEYVRRAFVSDVFGDGTASRKIVMFLESKFTE